MNAQTQMYVPALRMKTGELQGLANLSPDIAEYVLPRLVVPPPKDRDKAVQTELFKLAHMPRVGGVITPFWSGRPVLLQSSFLIEELGSDKDCAWLPGMFEAAREAGAMPIPLFTLDEIARFPVAVATTVRVTAPCPIGILLSLDDLADASLSERILTLLEKCRAQTEECILLLDFGDADLGSAQAVAPVIEGSLDGIQRIAKWGRLGFQGTNYPKKNPAAPGQMFEVRRNEWLAWKLAVSLDSSTASYLMFGDYGPDCADFAFSGKGGRAIRHVRYATRASWLVVRGQDKGRHAINIANVCKTIVGDHRFAGRDFCWADDQIFRIAADDLVSSSPTHWRALNVNRHITRAVQDIGEVRGREFRKIEVQPLATQAPLDL